MAAQRHLQAVGKTMGKPAGGQKRKAPPRNVAEAAESGDHRALLVSMRDRIAKAVSDTECPPRDLAALTRRLQDIAHEIAGIDLREKEEAEDGVPDGEWDEEAI